MIDDNTCYRCPKLKYHTGPCDLVDPIDQLHMMLAWQEDYTDEFKRKCLIEAIEFATQKEPSK